MRAFAEQSRALVKEIAKKNDQRVPTIVDDLFQAIERDRWNEATNLIERIRSERTNGPGPIEQFLVAHEDLSKKVGVHPPKSSVISGPAWHAMVDAHYFYVLTKSWNTNLLARAINLMCETLPDHAMLIGDTDVGRFGMSFAARNLVPQKHLAVVTQMQFGDSYNYCNYLEALYPSDVEVPSSDAFMNAARRSPPGTNALQQFLSQIASELCSDNRRRPIFWDFSGSLPEWAWDRLEPCGLVFRLSPRPLEAISTFRVGSDRGFWNTNCAVLVGDWLKPETTISEVCDFIKRVYLHRDLRDFTGSRDYLADPFAQSWFGMARHTSAWLYCWRCTRASETGEKERMWTEALYAYKQALVLAPNMALDLADLLIQTGLTDDARILLQTTLAKDPDQPEAKRMLKKINTAENPQ